MRVVELDSQGIVSNVFVGDEDHVLTQDQLVDDGSFWIGGAVTNGVCAPKPSTPVAFLKAKKREERDALIAEAQSRVDRYTRQKAMGVPTTDDITALYQWIESLAAFPNDATNPTWYEQSLPVL